MIFFTKNKNNYLIELMGDNKDKKVFVERELNDDVEGEYDDEGFFNTPSGSFWDPDGVYFNREGYDKHGGYYNDQQEYIPGPGWDEENNCYKDEINDDYYDEYGSDHDDYEDDGFDKFDLDQIQDEEKLLFNNMNDIEKITEDPTKCVHHYEVEIDDINNIKDDNKKDEPKKEEIKKEEEPKKEEPKKEESKKEDSKDEEPKKEEKKKSKLAMLLDGEIKEKEEVKEDEKKSKKKTDGKNKDKEENKKSQTKENKDKTKNNNKQKEGATGPKKPNNNIKNIPNKGNNQKNKK